jgi:uncharacterized protein (DUF362 family)
VVLKPNWVSHQNESNGGFDCLVTHTSVIEAVLEYVVLTLPSAIVIGDAPIQGCDFQRLRDVSGIDGVAERFSSRGVAVQIADFRRTVLEGARLGDRRHENRGSQQDYVLVDLAGDSLLESYATEAGRFRVTMYNPDYLRRTHTAGRHQYLIARQILESDVVVNLPKLKCHKKACITGALKNLVGINGNKEYLPHHRKGGSGSGGDCYVGGSWLKARAEDLLDSANRMRPGRLQSVVARSAELAVSGAVLFGSGDRNVEGSWYGNDTIWRTSLDLQRLLRYARPDGTLERSPQRTVISITDAIIAGEGEGPLAPLPAPAGLVTGALNPAAAEWVHAILMGFDPRRIPLVREAFSRTSYPITDFPAEKIVVRTAEGAITPSELPLALGRPFRPPEGWIGHCEGDASRTSLQATVA